MGQRPEDLLREHTDKMVQTQLTTIKSWKECLCVTEVRQVWGCWANFMFALQIS